MRNGKKPDLPVGQLPEPGHAGQTGQDPEELGVLRNLRGHTRSEEGNRITETTPARNHYR